MNENPHKYNCEEFNNHRGRGLHTAAHITKWTKDLNIVTAEEYKYGAVRSDHVVAAVLLTSEIWPRTINQKLCCRYLRPRYKSCFRNHIARKKYVSNSLNLLRKRVVISEGERLFHSINQVLVNIGKIPKIFFFFSSIVLLLLLWF